MPRLSRCRDQSERRSAVHRAATNCRTQVGCRELKCVAATRDLGVVMPQTRELRPCTIVCESTSSKSERHHECQRSGEDVRIQLRSHQSQSGRTEPRRKPGAAATFRQLPELGVGTRDFVARITAYAHRRNSGPHGENAGGTLPARQLMPAASTDCSIWRRCADSWTTRSSN